MIKTALLLLTAGLALTAGGARAQAFLPKPADDAPELALLEIKPLVVLLQVPDEKQLRKLAHKPADLTQYQAYLAQYNAQLKELVPRLWKFSSAVEFRPETDYETLRKDRENRTPVLRYRELDLSKYRRPGSGSFGKPAVSLGSGLAGEMQLCVVGRNKEKTVKSEPVPVGAMYASDIISALRSLQADLKITAAQAAHQLSYGQEQAADMIRLIKATKLLQTKILLLNQAELQDNLSPADIARFYPYPFEVVSLATIEAAVLAGDARYTYARRMAVIGAEGPAILDVATGYRIVYEESELGIGEKQFRKFADYAFVSDREIKRLGRLEKMVAGN